MRKIEKYFKDDITPNEAYDLLFEFAGYISLLPMNNQDDRINVYDKVMEFLNQETKPILTEDEKVILRNTNKDYEFIGRDDRSYLYMRVLPDNGNFGDRVTGVDFLFPNLFQFIQTRRRI